MFPTINHLNDLLPFVEANKQIRVKADEHTGLIVVCYMVQDEDTFAGEHEHFERECRGLTFYPSGKIASRTLHKFFNIGQRDDVLPHNLRWPDVTRIMVKRDGSMVTPVLLEDGMVIMKTKKTFTSKEAIVATELLHAVDNLQTELEWVKTVLRFGYTPTFEFTSPRFPIVLKYVKEELTLLHVRENVSGRYLSEAEIEKLDCPFPLVENVMHEFIGEGIPANLVSWEKLEQYALSAEGVEGVVIQFGQEMVKLKTKWYCDLHHAVTFTRWRDIARAVVADQSDDLKGAFALTGRSIEPILKVEHEIAARIKAAETTAIVHAAGAKNTNATAKDIATSALKTHELFKQIMRLFRGQEVNWMEWYTKNHLDTDWGLEVVGDDA